MIYKLKLLVVLINKLKIKNSSKTGFEPMRASPSDFESDSLTTRTLRHN
jgi:hypothetical protein